MHMSAKAQPWDKSCPEAPTQSSPTRSAAGPDACSLSLYTSYTYLYCSLPLIAQPELHVVHTGSKIRAAFTFTGIRQTRHAILHM